VRPRRPSPGCRKGRHQQYEGQLLLAPSDLLSRRVGEATLDVLTLTAPDADAIETSRS
jgi:hypothetical protein